MFAIVGAFVDVFGRITSAGFSPSVLWRRAVGLPLSAWGTTLAHAGLGVSLLGDGTARIMQSGGPTVEQVSSALGGTCDLIRASGARPILRALQLARVGEGYHLSTLRSSGSSVAQLENGLVVGTSRIYLVDSGALDPMPPGPITKLAMCNATRISNNLVGS